jgi:hypothetical protein
MNIFERLAKVFPQIFGNALFYYIILGGMVVVVLYFVLKEQNKVNMRVWYFATVERLITPLVVTKLTPKSVITKDDKTFLRRAPSWLLKQGMKNMIIFLGKVGRGVTWKLESTPDGKAEKVGTLYQGVESCLGVNLTKKLSDKVIDLLKQSDIFVCVEIEPDSDEIPKITEESALTEANRNMAELIGTKIKQQLFREDWIRNAGLIGIGIAATLVAQTIGVM